MVPTNGAVQESAKFWGDFGMLGVDYRMNGIPNCVVFPEKRHNGRSDGNVEMGYGQDRRTTAAERLDEER